jgi:hypothetical protein
LGTAVDSPDQELVWLVADEFETSCCNCNVLTTRR